MSRQAKKVAGVYERLPGSGIYHVQYRLPVGSGEVRGRLIRKAVGTRQEAIDYLTKVKHIRTSGGGVLPPTAKRPARTFTEEAAALESVSFGDLCDGLLAYIRANPSEYKDQNNPPQRIGLIKDAFGSRPAASIKAYEIADWLATLDVGPATRNRYKAVFSAIFKYGKERDKVTVNPARDVKQSKVNNGVIRYLTEAEEVRLRKVLQDDVDAAGKANKPQYKLRMQHRIHELDVSLGTGMRKGEQYDLVWPDVHFDRKELIARDTKNGTDRRVIMIDDVVRSLKALKAMAPELYRKRREEGRPNNSASDSVFSISDNKKWFTSAIKRAKITNYRWHDNRHTFCSRLAQSGASLKVIQEAAGHKTIAMSARYAHLDQHSIRQAMAVLNRAKPASTK